MLHLFDDVLANPATLITKEVTQNVGFNLSFRTLGDFGIDAELHRHDPVADHWPVADGRNGLAGHRFAV